MSLFQVSKPKSAPKTMVPSSSQLTDDITSTLAFMAEMAGITLGPGGRQVLIERQEINTRPIVTKDGVTVIKSLGYNNPVKQLILEAARDAAIRTAHEAGDGTTTATVLSASIVKHTVETVRQHVKISPQKIVREMEKIVPELITQIQSMKIEVEGEKYADILLRVASLSANGDVALAKKIVEGSDMVGDEGDMTIVEINGGGDSRYELERINGYTVDRGLEESARTFANGFINDRTGTEVVLEKPIFLLYDGVINDFYQIFSSLQKLHAKLNELEVKQQNIVLVAHGFSDAVLGDLYANWNHEKVNMKIFPLLSPEKAITNWRHNFLYDLQAYTGTPIFNPADKPMIDMDPEAVYRSNRVESFKCSRFKAMIFAKEDAAAIEIRVSELREQKANPESEYELNDLNVRIGKLTSGIVRLNIFGPIAGETREKRDRAEDAWMAIKGAIKHGAVPGGGYVLARLAGTLQVAADKMPDSAKKFAIQILGEALVAPVRLLYSNYGYNAEETTKQIALLLSNDDQTFDISEEKWVPKTDLLDSLPAVAEAIRNSIAISSLLGTMGGIVAFKRDAETDREEERLVRQFESAIGERGSTNASAD